MKDKAKAIFSIIFVISLLIGTLVVFNTNNNLIVVISFALLLIVIPVLCIVLLKDPFRFALLGLYIAFGVLIYLTYF